MGDEELQEGNDALAAAMEQASQGSLPAAETYYRRFLAGPIFVPERYQLYPLSDSPQYPNEFVNVLGIQDKERVVIPAFSHKAYIHGWCGTELQSKCMNGSNLLSLVPKGWWLVVNPGREVEKEMSPWEIDQLRAGEEGIPAVLAELKSGAGEGAVSLRPLGADEQPQLKQALREAAAQYGLQRLFLMREEGLDEDGARQDRLLLGAETAQTSAEDRDKLRSELQRLAAPHLIGAESIKIFVEDRGEKSMMLGLFQHAAPLYQAPAPPWWRRLLRTR